MLISRLRAFPVTFFERHGDRLGQAVWVAGPFLGVQVTRMATNIVLTHLLAPALFGVMVIVNTFRTGVELLTDVGIGQNIVVNPRGDQPGFVSTAWTIQILRGAILALVAVLAAYPITLFYDEPILADVMPILALVFILSGIQSPSLFLLQRRQGVRERAIFDILAAVLGSAVTIAFAWVWPSVWALVFGLVAGTAISTALSFVFVRDATPHLRLERDAAHAILHFGKWVFLSTAIYFAAMSFDRIVLAGAVSLAALGVYGLARSFADMAAQLVQRIGALLVMPKVAAYRGPDEGLQQLVKGARFQVLLLAVVGLAFGIAISDTLIVTLFDSRYHGAAFILPLLLVGIWFGAIATLDEAILMGTARPAASAAGNAAKFAVGAIALPLALMNGGMVWALGAIALSEVARYFAILLSRRRAGFGSLRNDILLTVILIVLAVAFRAVLTLIGVVEPIGDWWAMRSLIDG